MISTPSGVDIKFELGQLIQKADNLIYIVQALTMLYVTHALLIRRLSYQAIRGVRR